MSWDITVPAGSDNRGSGASVIRTLKTDLATALTTEGVFPGPDTSNPVYIQAFKSGSTASRPSAGNAGRWYYNTDLGQIQRDNGASWDSITCNKDLVLTGKKMVFYNSTAPVGWTQDTSNNDRIFRAVVGTGGGTGGTDSISVPPTHTHGVVTGNPTTSLVHTHSMTGVGQFQAATSVGVSAILASSPGVVATDASTDLPHTHSIPSGDVAGFTPKYLDIIICSKN